MIPHVPVSKEYLPSPFVLKLLTLAKQIPSGILTYAAVNAPKLRNV
jgi:hypothetical protein